MNFLEITSYNEQPVTWSLLFLLCLCVYAVACEEEPSITLPEGLVLVEDFVSPKEEAVLLAALDWSSTNDDVTGESLLLVVCGRLWVVFVGSWWSSN